MNYAQLLQKKYDEGRCFAIQIYIEPVHAKAQGKWRFADPEDLMTLRNAEMHLWGYLDDHDARIVKVTRYIPFGATEPVVHHIAKVAKKGKRHD